MESWLTDLEPPLRGLLILGAALAGGVLLYATGALLGRRYRRTHPTTVLAAVLRSVRAPMRVLVPALAVLLVRDLVILPDRAAWLLEKAVAVTVIASLGWLAIRIVRVSETVLFASYSVDAENNLRARQVRTQFEMLARVANVVIGVVAFAAALMLFEGVRQLGTSILASAGIAGIIVGFAAQRALGNLVAGMQVALAQPIRLDDVVIVEGEWGKIEAITLTYVVVRIWDDRRLVLPTTYFIEKPFQNWTRVSSELLGTVSLFVDYTVPVGPVRAELERVVREHPLWDGRVVKLQVVDATERTVHLRALVSARSAGDAWELRCDVRERLVGWLQASHPGALPRLRGEVDVPVAAR